MREIVLDTETTGLDPKKGHKLVEIAAVELMDRKPTGEELHFYINPKRDMPYEAFRIHGLSAEFLADKPIFSQVSGMFLDFIRNDPLIIHNAPFDMNFINEELGTLMEPTFLSNKTVDTLLLAREKFPGQQNSLDALCRRFGISLASREKHGALVDTRLLVEVYIQLLGGWEKEFGFQQEKDRLKAREDLKMDEGLPLALLQQLQQRKLQPRISPKEMAEHEAFLASM